MGLNQFPSPPCPSHGIAAIAVGEAIKIAISAMPIEPFAKLRKHLLPNIASCEAIIRLAFHLQFENTMVFDVALQ
jgi:hypothetical protein